MYYITDHSLTGHFACCSNSLLLFNWCFLSRINWKVEQTLLSLKSGYTPSSKSHYIFRVCNCSLISAFTYFKQLFKLMATWESQLTVALDTVPTAFEQSSRLHARKKDKGEAEQRMMASHIYSPGAVSRSPCSGEG